MIFIVNNNEGWVETRKTEASMNKFLREQKQVDPDFEVDECDVYEGDVKKVELEANYRIKK